MTGSISDDHTCGAMFAVLLTFQTVFALQTICGVCGRIVRSLGWDRSNVTIRGSMQTRQGRPPNLGADTDKFSIGVLWPLLEII